MKPDLKLLRRAATNGVIFGPDIRNIIDYAEKLEKVTDLARKLIYREVREIDLINALQALEE
jgi:hypothetical protein